MAMATKMATNLKLAHRRILIAKALCEDDDAAAAASSYNFS